MFCVENAGYRKPFCSTVKYDSCLEAKSLRGCSSRELQGRFCRGSRFYLRLRLTGKHGYSDLGIWQHFLENSQNNVTASKTIDSICC